MIPNVLSIAGTYLGGGAGIHADLKTFSALGGYGMAVVTALVAQTTTGVTGVHDIPPSFVAEQLETLLADVRVDVVKIGMLADAGIIEAVAAVLDRHPIPIVVLDPVMVAKSGQRLLAPEAVSVLRTALLSRVDLVTPNLAEAADLLGEPQSADETAMVDQAERLRALGAARVLLKGGHLAGPLATDVLAGPDGVATFQARRVTTANTHGTGYSAAIAILRTQRPDWEGAVGDAKRYLTGALRAADQLQVGHGHGPVHHFFDLWPPTARPV